VPVPGPLVSAEALPAQLRQAPPGTVVETSPASAAVIRQLAQLIARSGGAALIVDYGHERTGSGDTLQAVAKHGYADPWMEPGERTLRRMWISRRWAGGPRGGSAGNGAAAARGMAGGDGHSPPSFVSRQGLAWPS
jgi:hypothetical protein